MVVHDKVYNCTSFVDEHPYVFHSPLPHTLPPPFQRASRTSLNTSTTPLRNPTLAMGGVTRKDNETSHNHTPRHRHKEPLTNIPLPVVVKK